MNLKNVILIFLAALCIGWATYTLHLRGQLETSYKRIRELQTKQKVLVHKERLKVAQNVSDSLRKVIERFIPDTIFKERIRIKHDTIYLEVTKKTHSEQVEWVISELDSLY